MGIKYVRLVDWKIIVDSSIRGIISLIVLELAYTSTLLIC